MGELYEHIMRYLKFPNLFAMISAAWVHYVQVVTILSWS